MDGYTILSLISTFMYILVMERTMRVFYEKRNLKRQITLAIYALVYIILLLPLLLLRHTESNSRGIVALVTELLAYFILTLIVSSIRKRLVVVLITYMMLTSIAVVSSSILLTTSPELSILSEKFQSIARIIYMPAAYLIFAVLQRFRHIRKNQAFFPTTLLIPTSLALLLLILFSFRVATGFTMDIEGIGFTIMLGIILMVFIFSSFYVHDQLARLYEERLKLALHAQEREYYYTQCQIMQESVEQVKSVRHDMKFHLATLRSYSNDIKADKISHYVDSLLGKIRTKNIYSDSGNIAFDSILNFKLQPINEDAINVTLYTCIPKDLAMDVADIITIMGNLLDNAVAAVMDCKDKWLNIYIEYSRQTLFIQVKNPFSGVVKYDELPNNESKKVKIKSTKTLGDHGYGLKNVQKAVDKYTGQMEVNHENQVFCVNLLLYVDSTFPIAH